MKLKSLKLQVIFIQEKDNLVVFCPALDLASCGKDIQEAQVMFQEAAEAFFESCIERGVLNEVLEDLGWEQVQENNSPSWIPPHIINTTKEIAIAV